MGKKWRIGALILLTLITVGVLWSVVWNLSRPREPLYDGKSVSYWLGAARPQVNTIRAGLTWVPLEFPKADSNAVPVLIKALKTKERKINPIYLWIWRTSPTWLQMRLRVQLPDWIIRMRAVDWLRDLGEQARPAIPALIQVMQNDTNIDVRMQVPRALAAIDINDPVVHAALTKAANDKNDFVSGQAMQVLQYPTNYAFPGRR